MKTTEIYIENLKCHGCANTIKKELTKIPEVSGITVNFEKSMITVEYDSDNEMKDVFQKKLARLGYPEKGKKNIGNTAKSYVSCAIGRMHGEKTE